MSASFLSAMTTRATDAAKKLNTKNTKDNRLCVVVEYALSAVFKIPDGLDLEDTSVVKGWYVKYGTLHIYYTDGREEEIDWVYDLSEYDYKWGVGEYEMGKIEADGDYNLYEDDD